MRLFTMTAACVALALPVFANPAQWEREWPDTDFDQSVVTDWREILSGGPPKDGIPAIDDPTLHLVADEADLTPLEPVITLEIAGEVPRAYPVRYLMWHEIVNDAVGDVPVAVTFCPLCNSGVVFDRRVEGDLRTFGVSGKLRHSDMVMFDRETQSWWQQAIGEGIVGHHAGDELLALPSWMESWKMFVERNPEGLVMERPDFPRDYGRNPYVGYDGSAKPFLYNGENPPHDIPPLMRVVRVGAGAWPMSRLREEGEIRAGNVVLSWTAGQASALDARRIGDGKDVGNIRVTDAATGDDVVHDVMFAFAFHAFWPDGTWHVAQ